MTLLDDFHIAGVPEGTVPAGVKPLPTSKGCTTGKPGFVHQPTILNQKEEKLLQMLGIVERSGFLKE